MDIYIETIELTEDERKFFGIDPENKLCVVINTAKSIKIGRIKVYSFRSPFFGTDSNETMSDIYLKNRNNNKFWQDAKTMDLHVKKIFGQLLLIEKYINMGVPDIVRFKRVFACTKKDITSEILLIEVWNTIKNCFDNKIPLKFAYTGQQIAEYETKFRKQPKEYSKNILLQNGEPIICVVKNFHQIFKKIVNFVASDNRNEQKFNEQLIRYLDKE